ncbi:restriction endonuclease subunit S [Listeria ivanovii]|uniref:restriction endonuclease subunit S n=1 Tax=Listeria ivanovii TaxID=1638 RepID=UPI00098D30B5|nr:restriction endonuclease subunit S [Listeria ivanovii]
MSDIKKKVPKRRFEEFSNANDWEQRKLGEELNLLKDGTHGTHKDVKDGFYLLSAKNIKNGQIIIDELIDRKISEEGYNTIHKNFSLKKGDVLLTIVGSIGETSIIKSPTGITFQRSVAYLRPDKNLESQFLFTLINSNQFQDELKKRQVISAQPGIYLGDLSVIPIEVPNIEEQQKIGMFFKQLDNTIALHQRKLEKIKALKTAYLSEMFPAEGETKPKRRFAGFTDDWEQRKLDNSIKVMDGDRGSNYPHDSDFFDNGDTLFLDTGNVTKNGFKFDNVKYITKEKDGQLRAGKLEKNDFVLTSRGTLGNVGFYDKFVYKRHPKLRINSAMLILRNTDEQLSCSYLHTLLKGNLISDFMRKNQVGSAQPHITKSEFLKLDLNVPCDVKEQNKIGDFFKNLDNTITLHQRKLQKLQNIKKAYLNEMFI